MPAGQVDAFCAAFPSDEFYLNRNTVVEAVKRGSQFNLIHPTSGLKIDFMILTESDLNRSRVSRRRDVAILPDCSASFASPEDVILMKMIYYREGESEKHLRDIGGVLRVQGTKIDREYIGDWADRLGVADIWHEVLKRECH